MFKKRKMSLLPDIKKHVMRKSAFGKDTCLPKSKKCYSSTFFCYRIALSMHKKLQKNKIPLGPPLLASNLAAVDKDGGRN